MSFVVGGPPAMQSLRDAVNQNSSPSSFHLVFSPLPTGSSLLFPLCYLLIISSLPSAIFSNAHCVTSLLSTNEHRGPFHLPSNRSAYLLLPL